MPVDSVSALQVSGGQWAWAEDARSPGYPRSDAGGPLSNCELSSYELEISRRRAAWQKACDRHLEDLRKAYPKGFK